MTRDVYKRQAQAQHCHEQVGEQHTLGVGGTLLTVRCHQAGVLAQQHDNNKRKKLGVLERRKRISDSSKIAS